MLRPIEGDRLQEHTLLRIVRIQVVDRDQFGVVDLELLHRIDHGLATRITLTRLEFPVRVGEPRLPKPQRARGITLFEAIIG